MAGQAGNGHLLEAPAKLDLPQLPHSATIWSRLLLLCAVAMAAFLLDRSTVVLMDYWLLDQQGLSSVFWTNLVAGTCLFTLGFVMPCLAVWLGGYGKGLPSLVRRIFLLSALIAGMAGGYLLAGRYLEFLQLFGSVSVGEKDPVFGRDLGFYMFSLPALWIIWIAVTITVCIGLVAQWIGFGIARRETAELPSDSRKGLFRGVVSQPIVIAHLLCLGIAASVGIWMARYGLLLKDNRDSAIYVGAEEIDVSGLISNLNHYTLRALIVLALTTFVVWHLWRHATRSDAAISPRRLAYAGIAAVAADLSFAGLVMFKDGTLVTPNEPMVQLPYIKRHIEATRRAYNLESIETVEFTPSGLLDPLPAAEDLLKDAALKNAPLWPGWVSYLERVVDPQHADRILRTKGDPLVYGPVLDVFRAQQKLRSYYDFMDVDTVRYEVDGEKRIFVSSVRELPFIDPKPWIAWWGQRMLLFTHSHGLVAAPASEIRGDGEPAYVTHGIPMTSTVPALHLENPSLYYGEGAGGVMAFTNARNIKEFDYPTKEDRAEVVYPPSVEAGIRMDSLLKRIVVGWRSGVPLNVWFSDQIGEDARLHYIRPPIDRVERLAPFLFYDSNPFAVVHEGRIHWMVNALTTSDKYPYSHFQPLGDKSNEQSLVPRPHHMVNYVKDSVKATIDAYTGKVTLYKFADEPVVNTWANIYPALFRKREEMPKAIRAHLQYPRQLLHIQFDNVYYKYHMTDPLTFFNLEDMWDDADEVKGPILADGKSITFSVEPRHWMAETGGVLPKSSEQTQFVLSMVFTNEQALNLRAIPIVYQDGDDYGRTVVLQVPKGHFYPGPEQADAAIDQDPGISEQISWWNRTGSSVIRGHTSTLIVGNEVIYVEPLFIRSQQNPISQLKRVLVVFRGLAAAGATLEEALKAAMEKAAAEQKRKLASAVVK